MNFCRLTQWLCIIWKSIHICSALDLLSALQSILYEESNFSIFGNFLYVLTDLFRSISSLFGLQNSSNTSSISKLLTVQISDLEALSWRNYYVLITEHISKLMCVITQIHIDSIEEKYSKIKKRVFLSQIYFLACVTDLSSHEKQLGIVLSYYNHFGEVWSPFLPAHLQSCLIFYCQLWSELALYQSF